MKTKIKKSTANGKKLSQLEQVQEKLSALGYLDLKDTDGQNGLTLPPEAKECESLEATMDTADGMDANTLHAIKQYQDFHGLSCSGALDKDTLASLGTKRCGVPDLGEYNTQGNKWSSNNLTYGFQNYSPDNSLTQNEIKAAIAQAFALWAAETPLRFRLVNITDNPDIRIRFESGDHGDGSSFDGRGGTLAHAYYPPPNGGALAGDAHFDEAESWTIKIPTGTNKVDLVTVAAHEFGHSLGLRHSSVNQSLMFPSYSGPHRWLHKDDKDGIKKIYGSYKIAQASWIHGTSVQAEYPERLTQMRRAGFYSYITGKANTSNWFHFAIPSPVIQSGKRLKIAAAILRCRTLSKKTIIKHVHIYDGYVRIASHNNINLTGDHWFAKFGVAHKPNIYWGLGISVGVEFKSGSANERRIDFVSAGCDLIK